MIAVMAAAMNGTPAMASPVMEMMAVVPVPVVTAIGIIEEAVIAPIAIVEGAIEAIVIAVIVIGPAHPDSDRNTIAMIVGTTCHEQRGTRRPQYQ
jgi:hypothetical protein